MTMNLFADLALSRRLELAEGHANAMYVQARAVHEPAVGACWTRIAGTFAMFDGVDSPVTQTFGLGLFEDIDEAAMTKLRDFFTERGAHVFHEVSPLTPPLVLEMLGNLSYRPVELSNVMVLPIDAARPNAEGRVVVRVIEEHERSTWVDTAVQGWSEEEQFAAVIRGLMEVSVRREGSVNFLAEIEGRPVAAGGLSMHDGVALMAGASTIPSERKQGAQWALLEARLAYARDHGCDIAMMCAAPGSGSQRNAERHGFQVAYTRTKWGLDR